MTRTPYSQDEIILCAYIALYGKTILREKKIASSFNRSEASVIMKVQNIAAMLEEEGIERSPGIPALSGVTTGADGRRTNWEMVKKMIDLGKDEHKRLCIDIIRNLQS
jgi:hypothetical protein